ncbi:hypothetical protein Trydic_g8875 [Trypoxylus dichotomus]
MSENTMTLPYEDEQSVSTENTNYRNKNDATDDTTNLMLIRQPTEIKNNKKVDDVIGTQEDAENLAVNSKNVNTCVEDLTEENKKTESVRGNNSENVEVQTRDVTHGIRRRNYYFKRSRRSILANALIKRSIRW